MNQGVNHIDFDGTGRLGDNLYANSLLALDAHPGRLQQVVEPLLQIFGFDIGLVRVRLIDVESAKPLLII